MRAARLVVVVVVVVGVLATGCLEGGSPPEVEPAAAVEAAEPLRLPIEVMPLSLDELDDESFVAQRTFDLSPGDVAALAGGELWLQGHGLGYRDGHTRRDGKASVQLNDGPWVRLVNTPTNTGIELAYPEVAYQGIGGGFRTVRLTIDHATLCTGAAACFQEHNTIRFKFHGTDGTTSGYRIVDLALLTAGGTRIFDAGELPAEDPELDWPTPAPGDPDVLAGEQLWRARNALYAGPGGAAMIAACADCHAQDATDLEYFAFSDRSIVTRSVFHGLSIAQGEQIAAYVRARPAVRRGRPWNPPYQPGPDHDDAAPDHWAAGAGLDDVLDREDATMLAAMFPGGYTTPAIAAAIKGLDATGAPLPARTLNLRKLPIAIQMPDWNTWLPEVHPLDLWGVCAWESAGDGTFAPVTEVAAADLLSAPQLADVDGDRVLDVLSLQYDGNALDGDDGVLVHRGEDDPARTLLPPTLLVTGGEPADLEAVDLDGDRAPDLVVADARGDAVVVLLNDGLGGFAAPVRYGVGDQPVGLAAGDFDRDGDVDLATVNKAGDSVTVLRNDGAGGLAASSTLQVGDFPKAIAAGDLDGDGRLDLAVANYFDHDISVLAGDGAGGFADQVRHPSGNWPHALAIGDLDGDLDQDVAVIAGGLVVLANQPDGTFTSTLHPGAEIAQHLAIADLDRDGRPDVVTVSRDGIDLNLAFANVFLGEADGTLAGNVTYPLGGPPTGIAIGDLDLDFAADLVVTTGSIGATVIPGELSLLFGNDCGVAAQTLPPPPLVYDGLRAALPGLDRTDAAELAALPDSLGALVTSVSSFLSAGWDLGVAGQKGFRTIRGDVLDVAVQRGYSHELVKRSIAQWTAVKYWELMREFDLEVLGPAVYGADGEALAWPTGGHQSVFFVAPHLTSGDQNNYSAPATYPAGHDACVAPCTNRMHNAQTLIEGDYDSTSWYHLQMLLHAGARSRDVDETTAVSPVDWPYVLEHVDDVPRDIARTANGPNPNPAAGDPPWEGLRFVASLMKTYQMRDNGMGPSLIGWSMRDVSPRILVGNWRGEADHVELLAELNTILATEPNLRLKVTDAFLGVFLDVVNPQVHANFTPWPRLTQDFIDADNDRASWWRLDVAGYVPGPGPAGGLDFPSQGMFHHADHICRTLPLLRALGANALLVDKLEQWAEYQWPGPGGAAAPQDFRLRCP